MPAYMEIKNLEAAYQNTSHALAKAGILDYEIIIITNLRRDGSHDGTPELADKLALEDNRVRHIHNKSYVGLGFKYWQGVAATEKNFVMMIPGDNETVESSIADIISHVGEAEMVVTYTANKEVRALKRRLVSAGFTVLCNLLFGLHIKYFNGLCIHPRKLLQQVPLKSENFSYIAVALIYLIKSGVKYIETPMYIKPITNSSAAFNFKSVFEVLCTLALLFWDIHFKRTRIKLANRG